MGSLGCCWRVFISWLVLVPSVVPGVCGCFVLASGSLVCCWRVWLFRGCCWSPPLLLVTGLRARVWVMCDPMWCSHPTWCSHPMWCHRRPTWCSHRCRWNEAFGWRFGLGPHLNSVPSQHPYRYRCWQCDERFAKWSVCHSRARPMREPAQRLCLPLMLMRGKADDHLAFLMGCDDILITELCDDVGMKNRRQIHR